MKPVFSLAQIITQLTTSWGNGYTRTRSWAATDTVSYSFPNTAPANGDGTPPEAAGLVVMADRQKAAAELAFSLWDDLVPLRLTETNRPGQPVGQYYVQLFYCNEPRRHIYGVFPGLRYQRS